MRAGWVWWEMPELHPGLPFAPWSRRHAIPESAGGGRGVGSLRRRRRCEIVWEWVASLLEKPRLVNCGGVTVWGQRT